MMRLPCPGCLRPPLEIPEEYRDQIMALTGECHDDGDRFDGLTIAGWVVAFLHEYKGGVLVAVCPECRPRLLPTYADDGPEFPTVLLRKPETA
jgi:hypothetical protein